MEDQLGDVQLVNACRLLPREVWGFVSPFECTDRDHPPLVTTVDKDDSIVLSCLAGDYRRIVGSHGLAMMRKAYEYNKESDG